MTKLPFLFLSLLVLALFSLTAQAMPIDLSSLPPALSEELTSKFPGFMTPKPPLDEVDRALRYLMSKGSFEQARIVQENDHWKLIVTSLKTINEINFTGLEHFQTSDLQPFIQMEKGQKFDPRLLYETRDRIKNFYAEQGYFNTILDISANEIAEEKSEGETGLKIDSKPSIIENKIDLNFNLQEGPPARITSIEIVCPNKDLLSRLNRKMRSYRGSPYQSQIASAIEKDLTEYLTENHFFRALIKGPEVQFNSEKTQVFLSFQIERTESYSVNFHGNYQIPTARLISALEINTLSAANPNIVPELLTKLKEFYWKKGYARVEVKGEESISESNQHSTIDFTIKEGHRIKIDELVFSGSISRPNSFYSDFVQEHSGDTVRKNFFHRNDFENGLKNLITELQNNGYLKAKLISSRYLYNKDKTRISIFVNVDEGPLTKISEVRFEGLQALKEADLVRETGLIVDEPLKLETLERAIGAIKTHANELGFLEFRILNEKDSLVTYSNDNTSAHVIFLIEEGPRVKVGSILIDGNTLTKESVFRKELEFKEGDYLSPSKIEESTRRLQKLGLFNSVEIRMMESRTQIADRTVIVKVSERAPGLFNIGTGFTNERQLTVRGFAGIAYRNIQGMGRGFNTRAEVNYAVTDLKFPEVKLTAGYLEPYLWETRTKGRVNFTRAIQVTDYESKIGVDSYQLDFLLERQWTPHLLFTYDLWNISQLRDFSIDPNQRLGDFGVTQSILNLASTGPALEWDYRDHPFNPTRGTLTRLQMEFSDPLLGNSRPISYLRTTGSFTHYLPFYALNPFVFANSLRFGDLLNLNTKGEGVPYEKKGFVLGGISTIRGFEAGTSERFPNDSDLGIEAGSSYALQSRAQFFLIKSELRFPLFGSLGGALFYDGGLVTVDQLKFKDPYRDAAGFGIRYATPVGPANIEFAWKLDHDKLRNESPFRLHISIGTF